LDGTLLETDFDEIMPAYLQELTRHFAPWVTGEEFRHQLLASTQVAMEVADGTRTVLEIFSQDFFPKVGLSPQGMEIFEDFYRREFPRLGAQALPRRYAREAVEAAFARGYKVVVATNPIFPISAIEARLAWAGLEDYPYDLITSGEIMHFCKPRREYFHQTAQLIDCRPQDCLMIGNDPRLDLGAKGAGMATFLLDCEDPQADHWGTMEDVYHLIKRGA
jgi:FMN phosphatase YigB (HAD superfamily)